MFPEMELSSPKNKKFQEKTFRAQKIKKPALKNIFIFWEMEQVPSLKDFLCLRKELVKPEKQKFLIFL